jgi:uncharacterized protein (DUF3084 family)
MLDAERRDAQTLQLQLKVAVEAVHQCGEERAAVSAELSQLRIEREAVVRERDYLRDQVHTSQVVSYLTARIKTFKYFIAVPYAKWLVYFITENTIIFTHNIFGYITR